MKKNLSLIIGLSLPVFMILFVAGSIFLPLLFAQKPPADFLYSLGPTVVERPDPDRSDAYRQITYDIRNGKLSLEERTFSDDTIRTFRPYPPAGAREPRFFIHDVRENRSQEIPFEVATNLSLNADRRSPDGFEVVRGARDGGFVVLPFVFFGEDSRYDEQYLAGRGARHRLNLQRTSEHGSFEFRFWGWVNQP